MNQSIYSEKAPPPIGPYSQAVRAGDFLYVSGQLPINPLKDELIVKPFDEAVHQVMKNVRAVLQAGGMDWRDVVQVTVYLKDLKRFQEFNAVYATYVGDPAPARAAVEVARLPRDAEVEIACTAHRSAAT